MFAPQFTYHDFYNDSLNYYYYYYYYYEDS